jgi:hypothetical protein
MSETSVPVPPFWNIVAVVIPIVAILIGSAVAAGSKNGGGDFAGALGGGVLFLGIVAIGCLIGEVAAITALIRQERLLWLSILAIVGNAVVLLPLLGLFLRD